MLTGVVLAGGRSRRMGRNKALLPAGGRALIEIVLERVREACGGTPVLVANDSRDYARLDARIVPDALPSGHPLAGIYTGVLHAGGPAFVCACDMPFLNPALIRYLGTLAGGADAVVPRHGGEDEPLHAVYTPACLEPMRRCAERGGRTTGFFSEVRVRAVDSEELRRFDPDLRSFVNVNTPGEYEAMLRAMGAAGPPRPSRPA